MASDGGQRLDQIDDGDRGIPGLGVPPADKLAQIGVEAFQRGDYLSAIRDLEEAAALGMQHFGRAEILTILGNAHTELCEPEKAIPCYEQALGVDARFHPAWVALGVAHRLMGQIGIAEQCYLEALQIEPECAELHCSLGALHLIVGDEVHAIDSLERAISLDPSLGAAHGNLALAYAMARRFDAAGNSLRQSVILGYKNVTTIQERIAALQGLETSAPKKPFRHAEKPNRQTSKRSWLLVLAAIALVIASAAGIAKLFWGRGAT